MIKCEQTLVSSKFCLHVVLDLVDKSQHLGERTKHDNLLLRPYATSKHNSRRCFNHNKDRAVNGKTACMLSVEMTRDAIGRLTIPRH